MAEDKKEPTGIFNHPTSVSQVTFRQLADAVHDDGRFVDVQQREVTFVGDGNGQGGELPEGSKISFAGIDQTLPMAFDNNRFFDGEEGYHDLLTAASKAMEALSNTGDAWVEPDKEMGLFGWMWRWFTKFLMWLTNDPVNRLRFTRGIQDNLPFQSGYESFAIGGVVRAYDLDDRDNDSFNLTLAFKNRNASRVLVQNLSRWDWFWHTYTQITWSRMFDFIGIFPFIGITSFTATENFPASKNHVLAGTFRLVFEGSWITRFITGQQAVVTFDSSTAAQNLQAEATGFEAANRNQYGATIGREKTNEFRFEHRLPTDESIVRSFVATPASTMINNGVEHVLRCLAKHWRNMIYQENGNFAHQRMEQLDPFETLRFHMPVVLSTLASLRGRNNWDCSVLGPFIKKLQLLNPDNIKKRTQGDVEDDGEDLAEIYGPCEAAKRLVEALKTNIVPNVCGGIPSRMDPLGRWLDAIFDALTLLSNEAEAVREFVASVDTAVRLGYQLLKLIDWHVPTNARMSSAIIDFILDKPTLSTVYPELPWDVINTALHKLASKDERTLKELVKQGLGNVEAAKLLVGRTCSLLERELRRNALDDRIRELSKGPTTTSDTLEKNKWYWVNTSDQGDRVVLFRGAYGSQVKLEDVETNVAELLEGGEALTIRQYIPVAEAISRAQKAFMTVEIDHGKKFSYNAFMEFGSSANSNSLRTRLRRLIVLSQVHCHALDQARLNVLAEVRSSVQQVRKSAKFAASRLVAECKPQNVTVLGGGPTGLLSAIHCLQNVILSGGEVKLYEGRDSFDQEASSFERAQIVRLDPRQISMIRFHLGTGFEDVYIPSRGETNAHHGNTLPSQGFVEVTIKRLESMILDEIINLRSKDLIQFYSDSKIKYDIAAGSFSKQGRALKINDLVFGDQNENQLMEIQDLVYKSRVTVSEMVEGNDYDIVLPREKKPRSFRLVKMDRGYDWYQFECHEAGIRDVAGSFNGLPPVYLSGQGRFEPSSILVEDADGLTREISYDEVKDKSFKLDFSATHVIVALGKPAGSPTHFYVTTAEPYSVCCIEGLKISMGMHNFGEKRWGAGIVDDIRSHGDQNTRIIGDFTKDVALVAIVDRMRRKIIKDPIWKFHLEHLAESVKDKVASLHTLVLGEIENLCNISFRRDRLQTRFFELGNNYYLGMELPREFDAWKNATVLKAAPAKAQTAPDTAKTIRRRFQGTLTNNLDRLWYEACLEIIAEGDVYNPGGRGKIPPLYLIDSPFEQKLGDLKEQEAFRLFTRKYRVHIHDGTGFTQIQTEFDRATFAIPTKTYVLDFATKTKKVLGDLAAGDLFEPVDIFEVVAKRRGSSVVRTSGGYIAVMANDVRVGRVSDLARAPNGYAESKVSLAAFPVAHVVSHRTLRVNRVTGKGGDDGYITAYVGDAQSSPHFMRYSGLTGACINSMTFNNLVGQALQGIPFEDRIQRYSFETNWSNGEVVQRGTGSNYGQDGFLRPGFPYRKLVDYLYGRALEHREIGADMEGVLSRDWKIKLASAIVPRGLENDSLFYEALLAQFELVLRSKFEDELKDAIGEKELPPALVGAVSEAMDTMTYQWKKKTATSASDSKPQISEGHSRMIKKTGLVVKGVMTALNQTFDYSFELRQGNLRISSELFNQPKAVDSIVDDFAVEAQNFANGLTQSATFSAATIALRETDGLDSGTANGAAIASAVLGVWNIGVSFSSMTNGARYRNRNQESRRKFCDEKMDSVMKAVFSLMTRAQRDHHVVEANPFLAGIDHLVTHFLVNTRYYNIAEDKIASFEKAYRTFTESSKDQVSTIGFMRQLVQDFIPVTFQENSYLQEDLVNIYKALDEMLTLIKQAPANGMTGADELYRKLVAFRPELSASIERGDIKYGFLRDHPWYQTPLPVTLKFIFAPLLCIPTITSKTFDILKAAEAMRKSPGVDEKTLSKPVRDLSELYYATKESDIASMIFLSSFTVLVFSVFFSIFRLVEFAGNQYENGESTTEWIRLLIDYSSWALLGSLLGSTLAVFHFIRKLGHLYGLDKALGVMNHDPRIRRIRLVTRTQELLVLIRLLSVVAASVVLPWIIAIVSSDREFSLSDDIPVYIAIGAVCASILSVFLFFLVEFFIRYNLDPCLGRAVCEPFRVRIEQIKTSYTGTALVEIETSQKLEAEAWEYTARQFLHEFRFDTVFGADRFGTILQHLQSGNKMKDE